MKMQPHNNSDLEILIYSDFLIDTNQQKLSEEIKEEVICPTINNWCHENIFVRRIGCNFIIGRSSVGAGFEELGCEWNFNIDLYTYVGSNSP